MASPDPRATSISSPVRFFPGGDVGDERRRGIDLGVEAGQQRLAGVVCLAQDRCSLDVVRLEEVGQVQPVVEGAPGRVTRRGGIGLRLAQLEGFLEGLLEATGPKAVGIGARLDPEPVRQQQRQRHERADDVEHRLVRAGEGQPGHERRDEARDQDPGQFGGSPSHAPTLASGPTGFQSSASDRESRGQQQEAGDRRERSEAQAAAGETRRCMFPYRTTRTAITAAMIPRHSQDWSASRFWKIGTTPFRPAWTIAVRSTLPPLPTKIQVRMIE